MQNKNKKSDKINWIFDLKKDVLGFLDKLKIDGFFYYSLSGDLHDKRSCWGLGNTVFAVKIYYTIGILDELPKQEKMRLSGFINSFQKENGLFSDPLVQKKSALINVLAAIKNFNYNNFFGQMTQVAETRQSLSALKLLGENANFQYTAFPDTKESIGKHLEKLDWTKPWGAGSHFSHLLFFLHNSNLKNKEALIDFAIQWVNEIQNKNDGSWYKGSPTLQQKINGAMKVITGFKAANKTFFKYPEKLIDLCLSAKNDSHACDNFNIVYVLKYANELTKNSYKYDEIKDFCYDRLDIYRNYYFPEFGGFSFKQGKANDIYYGAKITKGLNEPDIHGTVMFLWGISIISQILNMQDKLNFKEFTT
ncbi:MAG TPA: hypothetical protein DCX32_02615 [Candidatus Moranbacteria bacterium]|nr:hypothetical protein [Candidatus Moranbacteria bacterium]